MLSLVRDSYTGLLNRLVLSLVRDSYTRLLNRLMFSLIRDTYTGLLNRLVSRNWQSWAWRRRWLGCVCRLRSGLRLMRILSSCLYMLVLHYLQGSLRTGLRSLIHRSKSF